MSLKAMNWVWDHSPAAGTELLVLLAIADNADDAGGNAFPSAETLARKTRLDGRTVQRVIRRLEVDGRVVVDRGGGRAANRYSVPLTTPHQAVDNPPDPVDRPVDNRPVSVDEVSPPPADCQGWQNATGGNPPPQGWHSCATAGVAQLRHRRGGTAAPPEPSYNRPLTPTPARDGTPPPVAGPESVGEGGGGGAGGGKPVGAVFAALGPGWPLSPAQRARLAPAVARALTAGWSPAGLAERLGANPHGVRSPVAVLEARLADLPPADTAPHPARPGWCGGCEQSTRLRETDTGAAYRCPSCHPLEASGCAQSHDPEGAPTR